MLSLLKKKMPVITGFFAGAFLVNTILRYQELENEKQQAYGVTKSYYDYSGIVPSEAELYNLNKSR